MELSLAGKVVLVTGGSKGLGRAIAADAKVLILDEPCAGLDAETEKAFFSTLYAAAEGRSVLLIAHRLTGAAYDPAGTRMRT